MSTDQHTRNFFLFWCIFLGQCTTRARPWMGIGLAHTQSAPFWQIFQKLQFPPPLGKSLESMLVKHRLCGVGTQRHNSGDCHDRLISPRLHSHSAKDLLYSTYACTYMHTHTHTYVHTHTHTHKHTHTHTHYIRVKQALNQSSLSALGLVRFVSKTSHKNSSRHALGAFLW